MKEKESPVLKEELEYLLSLEKATRLVGKSYEDAARTYNHSLESGEYADKFMRFGKLHASVINQIEIFLDEHVR